MKIPREPIESSNLASIGFDPQRLILSVEFKSGAVFNYAGVSLEVVTALYAVPSRGSFFAKEIRGKFSGQKMTGTCPQCGDINGWVGDVCSDCGCAEYQADPFKEKKKHDDPAKTEEGPRVDLPREV